MTPRKFAIIHRDGTLFDIVDAETEVEAMRTMHDGEPYEYRQTAPSDDYDWCVHDITGLHLNKLWMLYTLACMCETHDPYPVRIRAERFEQLELNFEPAWAA